MIQITQNNKIYRSSEGSEIAVTIEPDAKLFTTATHGGYWLIIIIDAAFLLIKRIRDQQGNEHKPIHIDISLLPVYSFQLNPFHLLTFRLIKHVYPVLPGFMKRWLPDTLRMKILSGTKESFFNEVYSGKKVRLQYGEDILTLTHYNVISWKSCVRYIGSYIKSIPLFLSCYNRRGFNVLKFLTLNYQNVPIGDLVAAITTRYKPQFGGSVKPCLRLFLNLANVIMICDIASILHLNKNKQNFAFFPESTFPHFGYQRTLQYREAITIHNYLYNKKFEILAPGQFWFNGLFVNPVNQQCSPEDIKKVEDYMDIRLFHAGQKLGYMLGKQNENLLNGIKDVSGNSIILDNKKLYAVIFLHSFDDDQYLYGPDGFTDLYEWVTFTVDRCLQNNSIEKILIKPHPCDTPDRYPTDKVAFQNLLNRYSNNNRIAFIEKTSSLVYLAENYHIFGITHHGSVAEEIAYLHQPVIASVHAPWQAYFSFVRTWESPEEYGKLIDSLSMGNWAPPSESEMHSLFSFILEYRLNDYQMSTLFRKDSVWFQIEKAYTGKEITEFDSENSIKYAYDNIIQSMSRDDPAFQKILKTIYDSN